MRLKFVVLMVALCLPACSQRRDGYFGGGSSEPACDGKTRTISGNFPRDLFGPEDTRANTWGHADYAILPIQFKPPVGCQVRILRLRGDMVAWPKTGGMSVADSRYAGILAGFQTTAPDGSTNCDWCADNTPLYIQGVVDGAPTRTPYDYQDVDTVLEKDNILRAKIASWLNDTGFPIHIELTYTIVFRFEDAGQ